jgi:hypothetical protein
LLAIGVIFYVAGGPTRRHAVKVPIAQEMGIDAGNDPAGNDPTATDAGS